MSIHKGVDECYKPIYNFDDIMFACTTKITEVSITVGNLKNNNAIGIEAVSADVVRFLLPMIVFSQLTSLFNLCYALDSQNV